MPSRKILSFCLVAGVLIASWFFAGDPGKAPTADSSRRSAVTGISTGDIEKVAGHKAAPSSKIVGISGAGDIPVPRKFQFANVATVRGGTSYKAWLAKYPQSQQVLIDAFQKRFPGVYQVTSEKQVAWMADMGYLMPEDVVEANALPTEELKRLADRGDAKAGLFYNQRLQDRFNEAQAAFVASGGDIKKFVDSPEGRPLFQMLLESNRVETAHVENPFVGYQIASNALSLPDPGSVASGVLRGLMQAAMAGDSRVSDTLLDDYYRAGILTDEQVTAARSAYSGVLNYLGSLPPECRARSRMPAS